MSALGTEMPRSSKMEKPENIDAAKMLVKSYRKITEDEVNDLIRVGIKLHDVPDNLLGVGDTARCTLCQSAERCKDCIYRGPNACATGMNEETYYAMFEAESVTELIDAFKARANHIENIINKFEEE